MARKTRRWSFRKGKGKGVGPRVRATARMSALPRSPWPTDLYSSRVYRSRIHEFRPRSDRMLGGGESGCCEPVYRGFRSRGNPGTVARSRRDSIGDGRVEEIPPVATAEQRATPLAGSRRSGGIARVHSPSGKKKAARLLCARVRASDDDDDYGLVRRRWWWWWSVDRPARPEETVRATDRALRKQKWREAGARGRSRRPLVPGEEFRASYGSGDGAPLGRGEPENAS